MTAREALEHPYLRRNNTVTTMASGRLVPLARDKFENAGQLQNPHLAKNTKAATRLRELFSKVVSKKTVDLAIVKKT